MLDFFSFGFGLELPAGRKTVQESSQQAAFSENKWKIYVSNSDNSNQRDSVSSKNHKLGLKFFVRSAGFYVALCAVAWNTQLQHWLDLVYWLCDPERHPRKPSQHALMVKKTKLAVRGAELHAPGGPWNCTMRTSVEKIWVWVVSVVGDLYPKEYKNARKIMTRFEKGWKGNLFCFITTFAVCTELCVIALKFFTCALISVDFFLNEVDLHK